MSATITKGFKGFDFDPVKNELYCQPTTSKKTVFRVGIPSVPVKGKVVPCKNGIHFCKDLEDVFDFYEIDENRYYGRVETSHEVVEECNFMNRKCATASLKITELIPMKEILKSEDYIQKSGMKIKKDLFSIHCEYQILFNEPEVQLKALRYKTEGKKVQARIAYMYDAGRYWRKNPIILVFEIL